MAQMWSPNTGPPAEIAHMPLVRGSTGGWQPASTVSGLAANNAASNRTRMFMLANQPRLSPLAQDRHRALTQRLATSGNYQPGMGGNGTLGNVGGGNTAGVVSGVNAAVPPGAINAARANLLQGSATPLGGMGQATALNNHYNNLMQSMLGASDIDMARKAAFQQAGLDYDLQTGRANSGLGWANLGSRFDELNNQSQFGNSASQTSRMQMLLDLLGG